MKYDSGGIARLGCRSSISFSNVVPLRETPRMITGASLNSAHGDTQPAGCPRGLTGSQSPVERGFRRFGYSRQSAGALVLPPRETTRRRLFVPLRARSDRNCQAVQLDIPMNQRPPTRADAATAGFSLIGSMLACGAAGLAVGSLFGLAVPLGLAGLFAGLVVGFFLVYSRYRRI